MVKQICDQQQPAIPAISMLHRFFHMRDRPVRGSIHLLLQFFRILRMKIIGTIQYAVEILRAGALVERNQVVILFAVDIIVHDLKYLSRRVEITHFLQYKADKLHPLQHRNRLRIPTGLLTQLADRADKCLLISPVIGHPFPQQGVVFPRFPHITNRKCVFNQALLVCLSPRLIRNIYDTAHDPTLVPDTMFLPVPFKYSLLDNRMHRNRAARLGNPTGSDHIFDKSSVSISTQLTQDILRYPRLVKK